MAKITGGEVLKRVLEKEGVKYIFGVPGDQLYPLLNAIRKSEIKFVTFHSEAAAAQAADAYSRTSGELGVVIGTVGPGAANLIGGVYPAFAENIPLLVITAQNQTFRSYPDHGSMQALDQYSLFKAVTKWNAVVNSWKRIIELTERAIRTAFSEKPGPVHLDFPSDILHETGEENELIFHEKANYRPLIPPQGNEKLIENAAKIIIESKNPLIHAGGGVLRSGAELELIELAEYLQIPVTTSISAKGVLPEDHPLCLIPHSFGAIAAQAEADLVILIGTKLGDLDFFGRPPIWGTPDTQKIIQIDISGEQISLNRQVDIGIVGDARETLRALNSKIKSMVNKLEKRDKNIEYKNLEKQWLSEFEEISLQDNIPIHPLRVIREVRKFYPKNAISVIDGGNTTVWSHYMNRIYCPRCFLSSSAGDSGHIGTGVPYSIGAKLSNPDREVYCITGDGAFGYGVMELETAKRLGISFTVIILNDFSWGMIKSGQTLYYDKNYIGVDFSEIRYDEIARAMGCYGERVIDPRDLRNALKRARDSGLPAVIDVKIDPNVIPPDFQTLASIWLEGCESPPKESLEYEKILK
ncbi:MAG: thiamine pyrophosphate-binding protein [Thermoplasmata archaeon]